MSNKMVRPLSFDMWILIIFIIVALVLYARSRRETQPDMTTMMMVRNLDGRGNNLVTPTWGAVGEMLKRSDEHPRKTWADVEDLPPSRRVSNAMCSVSNNDVEESPAGLTHMMWVWGQFLDHEIDLTKTDADADLLVLETESAQDDPNEDFPGRSISFRPSKHSVVDSERENPNSISGFIDATNVYGFSNERAYALRRLDGTGKMITNTPSADGSTDEELLPFNTDRIENATHPPFQPEQFFLAGDIRSNENIVLTSMHTLFVREHNRQCDEIAAKLPQYAGNDEVIYQHAKRRVIAIMQCITFKEFLPKILGTPEQGGIPEYSGYKPDVCALISTEFSTAGYRFGHAMLTPTVDRVLDDTAPIPLREAFFRPDYIVANGCDDLLAGATRRLMKKIGPEVVDELRNFLFHHPTHSPHLLDLATLNIQRGRDHSLPSYTQSRENYGLTVPLSWAALDTTEEIKTKLQALYPTVRDIDLWVGCLMENHVEHGAVGPLIHAILKDQFTRLRDGDRFYFENDRALTPSDIDEIKRTSTLKQVIVRNCSSVAASALQDDVFVFQA